MKRIIKPSLSMLALILLAGMARAEVDIPNSQGHDFYRSIGMLRGALRCSASFVQVSENTQAPAYFLTNGHCAMDPFPSASGNKVLLNKPVDYTVKFNYFTDTKENASIAVHIDKVIYATMKETDFAILSAGASVQELIELGLTPYKLFQEPQKGEPITVAGIPVAVDALQLSTCLADRTLDVVEYHWHWYQMVKNNCKGIAPGSSGSPVFNLHLAMVGIINTTSIGHVGETCYNGNPCEVDEAGAHIDAGKSYFIPSEHFMGCFNADFGLFDLSQLSCRLPTPSSVEIENYPYFFSGLKASNQHWKFTLKDQESRVRYKEVRLSDRKESCQDINGYSEPVSGMTDFSGWPIAVEREGVHQFCLIRAGDSDKPSPEVIQVFVDNTPPLEAPEVFISPNKTAFQPIFQPPEYSDFYYATGNPAVLNCEKVTYQRYYRIPIRITEHPTKVCLYGHDYANNESQYYEYIVE
ncbi:S1 family peptidase [Microbulbifer sp. 2304DJ12-6]|uniref:S1 family peptidase n=1 Tax=Microbulbifer sp. 2304DJ12-6 TaxID=3233340 RepID=UPI0039AFF0B3